MIQKEQVRLYQMILAGLHAFLGGLGVLIGLAGLLIPFGILALTAFDVMESLKYALEDPSYFSYWLEGMMGRLTVVAIVAAIATLPSAVAIASGAVGLGTGYGLYARKPWVKFLAIAAAIDCVLILGNPLFGIFALLGIAMAVFTLMLTWGADGFAELNDGPPGLGIPTPAAAAQAAPPAIAADAPSTPIASAPPPPAAPPLPEAAAPPPPPEPPKPA